MNNLKITQVNFNENFSELKNIRTTVFIDEQNVPVELEWDEYDKDSTHFLAYYKTIVVATARLLNDGHIGRMAVLKAYRNQKIGKSMLEYVVNYAICHSFKNIQLSAQEQAIGFYQKQGFVICSNVYPDAGIPHYDMKYIG